MRYERSKFATQHVDFWAPCKIARNCVCSLAQLSVSHYFTLFARIIFNVAPFTTSRSCSQVQPQALGFAPHTLQVLNTPDNLGRIVIHHKPRQIPIEPGYFQVVVGAAAAVKYSVQVCGQMGENAGDVLNLKYDESMAKQTRLTQCSTELEELWTSMRLAERKILVCQGLIDEAESESARCESDIEICNKELADDDENLEMTDEERNDILREIKVLEVEFSHCTYAGENENFEHP